MTIKKKGFTLLEGMIVLALLSVVLVVIYTIFLSGVREMNETNVKSNLQADGQIIQNSFLLYGNQGSSIDSINGQAPQNNSNSLNLRSLRIVLLADSSNTVEYDFDNATKTLVEVKSNNSGTATKVLSTNVSNVSITPVGNSYNVADGISINVTLEQKGTSYNISSKIMFRNKGVATP